VIIDCYIPNRLKALLDGMVNQYISETEEQLKPNQLKKLEEGMACLVYNISHCVSTGENEFVVTLNTNDFSKPIIYNGVTVKRKVSCLWFKRCLYWMVEKEWLYLSVGSVETWKVTPCGVRPDKVSNSLVTVSEELVEVFKPVSSAKHLEISKNVLELRNEDGDSIPFRLTDSNYRLIELLDTYNQYLLDTTISIGDSKYVIQGKKVFNEGSWSKGGRTYLMGVKVMSELLKRENRGKIMIDGEETVELDWSRCFLSIIAEKEGYVFPDGFDPYHIELEGYHTPTLRKLAKIAMLVALNSSSSRQASLALSMEAGRKLPLKDLKRSGKLPDPLGAKLIVESVVKHNQYALPWVWEGRGLELTHTESQMMDYVLHKCLEESIVGVVIHDGIVVKLNHVDTVREFMYDAYEFVLKSKDNCKVEVK
jgi:hypothetical protein